MRELLAARKRWLTVFRPPAYAPDLNPAEGVWANLKNDLGNLAACTVDALADLTRTRLKKMQYRPDLLDGFIAETGLTWIPPGRHPEAKTSVAVETARRVPRRAVSTFTSDVYACSLGALRDVITWPVNKDHEERLVALLSTLVGGELLPGYGMLVIDGFGPEGGVERELLSIPPHAERGRNGQAASLLAPRGEGCPDAACRVLVGDLHLRVAAATHPEFLDLCCRMGIGSHGSE